ncbi:MAG: hypothetical protein PF487_06885 [Bacteroidales bacterium]|jgi:hypothetical protein|nr:hypothetical protein [Bacteroidales bacterium]
MAIPRNKQRNVKRLNDRIKKYSNNPKIVERLNKRLKTLENTKD